MTNDNSVHKEIDRIADSGNEQIKENPDHISIIQWVLLFAVLGAVIYLSPYCIAYFRNGLSF